MVMSGGARVGLEVAFVVLRKWPFVLRRHIYQVNPWELGQPSESRSETPTLCQEVETLEQGLRLERAPHPVGKVGSPAP